MRNAHRTIILHVIYLRAAMDFFFIIYFDLWEQVFEDANEVVEKVLKGLLKNLKLQPRWMKGVSSMIIALMMVC
jgi:hypothetical protein